MFGFGFGFKKTKVLASAEKKVKQGKLPAAISDYERIAQEDPHDLNVLNTIGDLYLRLGKLEQATHYFKRVGDTYASEGFVVKAIAMYKKLNKQNPNQVENILKLAELYAQQGMNTEARAQYLTAAEQFQTAGDIGAATKTLQSILDLDPDNVQVQSRLAEIYISQQNPTEARDLYFRSAQILRGRGQLEVCDQVLGKALELDAGYSQALMLQGQVRFENGNPQGTVQCLACMPDLDSRPEALRLLLRAYLKLGDREEAEPLSRKILTVFNDTSGIRLYGDALLAANDFQGTLDLYREFTTQLLAANTPAVLETLHKLIAPLKDSSRALESLHGLFETAGSSTHLAEVTELLAHAYATEGDLGKARDLYRRLGEMEPENPLHLQNYRQIKTRLGEDSAGDSAQSDSPAMIVQDLSEAGPCPEPGISAGNCLPDQERAYRLRSLPVLQPAVQGARPPQGGATASDARRTPEPEDGVSVRQQRQARGSGGLLPGA